MAVGIICSLLPHDETGAPRENAQCSSQTEDVQHYLFRHPPER
jgi:hypothetical protein